MKKMKICWGCVTAIFKKTKVRPEWKTLAGFMSVFSSCLNSQLGANKRVTISHRREIRPVERPARAASGGRGESFRAAAAPCVVRHVPRGGRPAGRAEDSGRRCVP